MTDTSAPWPRLRRDLVAILRGVQPHEIDAIGDALVEEGFEAIEVPLNSPDPLRSIERLAARLGSQCLVGAGTVLSADNCRQVAAAGGRLMVSPNVDTTVLAAAAAAGMVSMPGVFTPTEAFQALAAGASGLKFFPAGALGSAGISAMKAVLPRETVIAAVGGVSDASFADYARIGVRAFGLGSSLYRPGDDADAVRRNARAAVTAYDAAFA